MKGIGLFLISFSASAAFGLVLASDCSQYANDCEYYSCVSNSKHCSDESYPENFGKRYCLRYEERKENFSEEGKTWIQEVRKCLIQDMSTFENDLSCSQLRKRAFKGHVPCYVESGYCNLSLRDKIQVTRTIWPSIRNVYILASGINILKACH